MTTTTGSPTAPGRRALRRATTPQGPSSSLLTVGVPAVLSLLLAATAWNAWSSLRPLDGLRSAGLSATAPALEGLPPSLAPQVLRWAPSIRLWASASGLDPTLVAVVMQIESCGDPTVRSPSGAVGLFQVMPYHFQPGDDPLDPDTNASRGLAYLSESYELAHGDLALALAGYNGGHGVISLPSQAWPDETRRYVAWGTGLLNDIASGSVPSPTLNRWLQAGGDALCSRAQLASLPPSIDP